MTKREVDVAKRLVRSTRFKWVSGMWAVDRHGWRLMRCSPVEMAPTSGWFDGADQWSEDDPYIADLCLIPDLRDMGTTGHLIEILRLEVGRGVRRGVVLPLSIQRELGGWRVHAFPLEPSFASSLGLAVARAILDMDSKRAA